jgi:uncharacterized caspase-like protein
MRANMPNLFRFLAALVVLIAVQLAARAGHAETRIALVIGNAAYQAAPLNTTANDAGLIAQTLQASGFDVAGARDLDQDSLRRAFHDFLDKASASGPDTVAFVYLAGYGLQLEGENYFVPIDAKIARDADVPAEAVRISDYTRPLAALGLKAVIVVLDAARTNPFAKSGQPLAGGLALVEPEPGTLIAFNAAPGTVASEGQGPYGAYAQALAEMMREGGLSLNDVFDRTRLRVNERTQGGQVPWDASKVQTAVVFFERAPDAPAAASADATASLRGRPIRDLDAQQAYLEALDRDTLQGYLDFVAAYPNDPMAARVRAIIAARREAIVWRHTRNVDTPDAYWSYLQRYPRGPHAADARRRLAYLAATLEPPPSFAVIDYDVPPPPPDEFVYVDRPVLYFDDPDFDFPPPPPPLVVFLPPPPPDFYYLPPPPPPVAVFVLPIPVFVPVPVWCRPPPYVAPPPNNVIFANIHNRIEINNTTNIVTITNAAGHTTTLPATTGAATAVAPGAPVTTHAVMTTLAPALPPSIARKAVTLQNQSSPVGGNRPSAVGPGQIQTQPGQNLRQPLGQPLPGAAGKPLPPISSVPSAGGAQSKRTTQGGTSAPLPQKPLGQPLPGAGGKPLPPTQATGNGNARIDQSLKNPPGRLSRQPPGLPLTAPNNKSLPSAATAAQPGSVQTNRPTQFQRGYEREYQQHLQSQIRHAPPPPTLTRPSPPAATAMRPPPPPVVNRESAPIVNRAPQSAPVMRAAPPPVVARPAPPPPRTAPPPKAASCAKPPCR